MATDQTQHPSGSALGEPVQSPCQSGSNLELDVPLPTGLTRADSGIFHLRIGVPDEVRPYWPPQPNGKPAVDAFRKSLGTRDRAEAVAQAHEKIAEYQRRFAALLARSRPQFTQLTPKLVEYLDNRLAYELLGGDDIRRIQRKVLESVPMDLAGDMPDLTDIERLNLWAKICRTFSAEGHYGMAMGFVDKLLDHMGLPPADWTGQHQALALFARTLAKAYTAIAQRSEGAIVETPRRPAPLAPPPPALETPSTQVRTLRDALPSWQRLTNAKPNAIQRMDYALALWETAVGMVPLEKITRGTGADFLLYLLDEDREFGRKTAKNHASNINALMNKAVQTGLATVNPLDLSFEVDDSESRTPWTPEQLQTLHGNPIIGEQPLGIDAADAQLLVSMLLWSGARISEVAGLRVKDIHEREGVVAAYIRRETTKNDESVRWLPIPKRLQGHVLAHAQRRKDEGATALFASFHTRPGTNAGDFAGRWFREHRESLGLPAGPLYGSHKWRHTVRTKLASEGIGEALLDAVTGHKAAGGSAGRKSYTHAGSFPLPKVLDAVERLGWPWPHPDKN